MKNQPPKLFTRFLRWFCRDAYYEGIMGDLEEQFYEDMETHGKGTANRRFTWNVLRFFRPGIIKNLEGQFKLNQYGMFKNYVKIAIRVFKREKSFTAINVLGLALGLAISLLIIQYARFEFSYESMYSKSDRIVRVTTDYMDGETIVEQDCEVYPPVGIELKARYPEVEDFTRAYDLDASIIQKGIEQYYLETIYAADPSFFQIFNTPFIHGDPQAIFKKPHEVVLTESTALKVFNRIDVINEVVKMPHGNENIDLKVVGVVEDGPANTHLKYDMLLSYPTMKSNFGEKDDNWDGNNTFLYVLLFPNVSLDKFALRLDDFNERIHEENKAKDDRFVGQSINDIHLYSSKSFEPETNGSATSVYFLLGVAFLVIVSALVNYVNLATSKALDRAKEVGIRKVVGSSRPQLAIQFLVESMLLNLMAAFCSLVLMFLALPWFIELAGLPTGFEVFTDVRFWELLAAIVTGSIFLSGFYPALVMTSFQPVSVMKGKFGNYGKGVLLRKGLVVFQFAITIVLLVQTFTVYLQLDYMRQMDLGINVDQTVVVHAPGQDSLRGKYSLFKGKILAYPQVESVTRSESVPGLHSSSLSTTTSVNLADATEKHSYNYYINRIDEDYLGLMGIELLAGENFKKTSHWDKKEVIANEEAIRLWNFTSPEQAVGAKLKYWGSEWTVIGVVKNYRQESPKAPFIPMLHKYSSWYSSYASVRFKNGNPADNLKLVRQTYDETFPNAPFEYFFLDAEYDKQFRIDQQFQQVFTVITGFAIFIACLGLFGLASFTVSKRTKEIGIRKVVGASVAQIILLLSSDFMKTVALSALTSIPVTYWLVVSWLDNFSARIGVSWWLFCVPIVMVMVLAIASMSLKTWKVAFSNPVDSLRDE